MIGSISDRELQRALRRQKGFTFGEYRKQVQEDAERTGRKVGWSSSAFQVNEVADSDETPIVCAERKRDHRVGSSRARMSDLFRDEREGAEMNRAGVSTRLELYRDPWEIKKKLKPSDVGHLSRLLLPRGCVETHMLWPMGPQMREEMVRRVQSIGGMKVAVLDLDTGGEHQLVFRRWPSSGSYVLNEGWNKLFVKGRGLKVGDEIGMIWDPSRHNPKFHFKVLRRAARDDQ